MVPPFPGTTRANSQPPKSLSIRSKNLYVHGVESLKLQLKEAQTRATDDIALAKAAWSAHQAELIHNMRFEPK